MWEHGTEEKEGRMERGKQTKEIKELANAGACKKKGIT